MSLGLLIAACAQPSAGESASSETISSTTSPTGGPTGPATLTGESSSESSATAEPTSGECPAPLIDCDGACVDPDHDPDHCGGCEQPCVVGLVCQEGTCGVACGPTADICGDHCTDLDVDPAHCGGCDHACPPGAACVAGGCVITCPEEQVFCGEACVSLASDEAHCGGCESACAGDQPCVFGRCVEASLHHLLISGQSLSVGSTSAIVSVDQPYANVSFNTGVRAGSDGLTALIPLVETQTDNLGETIASGTANLVAELEQARGVDHRILASAHGVGGQPYTALKKGTNPFAAGMAQVAAGLELATTGGDAYAVRAVAIIHGERDHKEGTQTYAEHLLEWQSDYEADVQAVTGQAHPVVMFLCQMSSFTRYNTATSVIPGAQLEAARLRPDRIFVVGPKYFLPYTDGVHLSGDGERWLGEYYAKVYRRVLIDGEPWRPLSPRSVSREGEVITIDFHVPAPPLVFDEVLVANPGMLGFEFTDNSGAPPEILDVAIASDTAVRILLSAPPVGGGRKIRYAFTGVSGQPAGPQTGARGNLRDSDMTPSRHDYSLYNWAVHFEADVD